MEITKIKIGSSIYDIKDVTSASSTGSTNSSEKLFIVGATSLSQSTTTYSNDKCYVGTDNCLYSNGSKVLTSGDAIGDGDTKNTAGTTNLTNTKLFLAGASTQSANPITYSNSGCYIGTDNCLYTNGNKTVIYSDVTDAIYTELYGSITKPTGAYVITNLNLVNAINEAGISTGGVSNYYLLGYPISRINGSSSLSIPGTDPVYVVSVSSNISSVSLQTNPPYGHSCHVIFKSSDNSEYTVAISHDNTNRICPNASEGIVLTVPASGQGYVEADFLNSGNSTIGDEVYVRGF